MLHSVFDFRPTRTAITSTCPACAAKCNDVHPRLPRSFNLSTAAPLPRSLLTACAWPPMPQSIMASCRANSMRCCRRPHPVAPRCQPYERDAPHREAAALHRRPVHDRCTTCQQHLGHDRMTLSRRCTEWISSTRSVHRGAHIQRTSNRRRMATRCRLVQRGIGPIRYIRARAHVQQ